MAMAMFYGWENAIGSAFIKGKNLKNFPLKSRMASKFQTGLGSSSVNKHFWPKVKKVDPP